MSTGQRDIIVDQDNQDAHLDKTIDEALLGEWLGQSLSNRATRMLLGYIMMLE